MSSRFGWPVVLTIVAASGISMPAAPQAARQTAIIDARPPDFDIRDTLPAEAPRVSAAAAGAGVRTARRPRVNRDTGTARVLDNPAVTVPAGSGAAIAGWLPAEAAHLGLQRSDLASLVVVRDYVTRATGVRHLLFRQEADGYPVFDSSIALHLGTNGRVLRLTSNAAPIDGRNPRPAITAGTAITEAARHAAGDISTPTLAWLPVAGTLRLAWHMTVSRDDGGKDAADVVDVLIDAQSGELLLRRSRVRDAQAVGRVLQSAAKAATAPRQPDAMPMGDASSPACPPPSNHELRALDTPFRDAATVVAATGNLEGNNARIFRGNGGAAATGTPTPAGWLFDFPFNTAASAETHLFFAANFAHDFFYDLGFDEAAGNFQVDNFARGGVGGDPLRINARAAGRNNANYVHAPDGTSATINMFLWDGAGCWGADVDHDGTSDLDGDYDLDIFVHEFHHGVSLRLNTAFTGNEAGAIGEGGSDFFAYSVNADGTLAEYSRPGGLRSINGKGYADWSCLLGLFCEVHENGEIWANVLWDVRERFRADTVAGGGDAAIHESHQLYFDGLSLSPPAPTMLDMRDAMLVADTVRNPAPSTSANYCRLWESFAGRGMGVSAQDTADSGLNQVTAAYDVPAGCVPPPGPPAVTIAAMTATATEAGTLAGSITIRRDAVAARPLTVSLFAGGSATPGLDYVALANATIPAGAAEITLAVMPVDDTMVENNETVTVTLRSGTGYIVGSPAVATVTIVSDDVAPDMTVSALAAPAKTAPGAAIAVTDTTRNQGTGAAPPSQTTFLLSRDALLDASDTLLGARSIEPLAVGATSTGTANLVLPDPLAAGTYFLFAKADGAGQFLELNDNNNIRAATIAIGPDLTVSAFTAPGTASAGSSILVNETTSNQGAAPAPASSTRFFLSSNALLDAADLPLEARPVPALAANGASTATSALTLPSALTTGTYYLLAQADGALAVAELNEINNIRSAPIRIGADLLISTLAVPSRAAAGGNIAITDTTGNSGSGGAGPSTTAFYLSSDFLLNAGDIKLSPVRSLSALAAGQASTATTTVTMPMVVPGTWYILANADDTGSVVETQETNNVRFSSVLVGPDLSFQSAGVPASAAPGTAISITSTVRNGGAGAAAASTTRFYLSANMSLDSADVMLEATQPVPGLLPDGVHMASTTVPLPADRSGTFYLLIVADADRAVQEASEGNNLAARIIQLIVR
jgi:subtilase family serine protease